MKGWRLLPCALLLISCSDPTADTALRQPSFQQAQITDPDINPEDSWTVFDASVSNQTTVQLSHPIIDPVSGQPTTEFEMSGTLSNLYHVEAGYDQSGILRTVVTGSWGSVDSASYSVAPVYRLVLSNGQLTQFAINGVSLPVGTTDGSVPAPHSMLAEFGSDLLYGDITGGLTPPDSTPNQQIRLGLLNDREDNGERGARERRERTYRQTPDGTVLSDVSQVDSVWTNGVLRISRSRLMRSWMTQDLQLGSQFSSNTSNVERAQTQANQLVSQLISSGAGNYVAVGYSMGGIVARRAAQQRPDLVRAVVSIGTPHRGAFLARQPFDAVTALMTSEIMELNYGCTTPYRDVGCYVAAILYHHVLVTMLQWTVQLAVPAHQDLTPIPQTQNSFLQSLNSTSETFPRFGIQSFPSKRFVLFRQGGDLLCSYDEWCGGRRLQGTANDFYSGLRFGSIVASILGWWDTFFWMNRVANAMDNVDEAYNDLTAPGPERTDAIVHGSSQLYLNGVANFPSPRGESHAAEMESPFVREQLRFVLNNRLGIPRR